MGFSDFTRWIEKSAYGISEKTIGNCWRKAGLVIENENNNTVTALETVFCSKPNICISEEKEELKEAEVCDFVENFITTETKLDPNVKKFHVLKILDKLKSYSDKFFTEKLKKNLLTLKMKYMMSYFIQKDKMI